jgi:heavy metal translocating P-type ATPase
MTKGPYLFDEFFSSGLEETISPFLTSGSRKYAKNLQLRAVLIAAICLILAFIFSFFHTDLSHMFLIIVYVFSGTRALIDTIEDIKKFEINIDVLMTLAAFLSVLIDSALEGGLLLVLFALSGAMEDVVEKKSKSALYKLHQITPIFAQVLSASGSIYEKSIREITVGTKLVIRPGDVIPLDGVILKGTSYVNLLHLTGESEPISKKEGDQIQAGSRNLDGSLIIEVLKTSSESTLSRIIQLINQAQETKPRVQKILNRFSKVYAITIICLSFFFILLLPYLLHIPFTGYEGSIYRGLAFLIAASPCAIIIATPTAYLSAISACARKGILLKGGVSLDALTHCKIVAFDKTGTLTTGKLKCMDFKKIYGGEEYSDEEALSIAATLESYANHPIAKAVTQYARDKQILLHELSSFKAIAGYGLEGEIQSKSNKGSSHKGEFRKVFIGNPEYIFSKISLPPEATDSLKTVMSNLFFPICILLIHQTLFLFTFEDDIKPNIAQHLDALKKDHHLDLLMVTGDHEYSAKHVGKLAHIDDIYFDLRPEDKLQIISDLSLKHHLAMVGDGINDAPALARATVGISMGQIASDTAIDASDIVLLQDDLALIHWLFKKAKQTVRIVKQNLSLALGIILIVTTPALLGFIPLWLAVTLHEGGTVIVGINGLRLLKK